MNAYIYQADIYCEDCGVAICRRITRDNPELVPGNPADEHTYDSDDYPKGPFPNGGGEADIPQHCGMCSVFLENPLTSDGEQYVRDAFSVDHVSVPSWREYYSYLFE